MRGMQTPEQSLRRPYSSPLGLASCKACYGGALSPQRKAWLSDTLRLGREASACVDWENACWNSPWCHSQMAVNELAMLPVGCLSLLQPSDTLASAG